MHEARRPVPNEEEVLSYLEKLSNWGRWGDDDQRGTTNLITPAVTCRAASLVEEGISISLALEMRTVPPGRYEAHEVTGPVQRHMLNTGQGLDEPDRVESRYGGASRFSAHTEWLGFGFHGPTITHVDAFSHVSWDRKLYGGAPAASVTSQQGATSGAVTALADGVMTRGVLIDAPKVRGVPWLEESEGVFPEDLEAAEAMGQFEVGEGDAVVLRTGYRKRVREVGHMDHFKKPGWHAACLPWLHERNVAMIGSDVACDVAPSGYETIRIPCHVVCLVAMGMPILDECDPEQLAEICERLGRYEFLLTLAPLRISGRYGQSGESHRHLLRGSRRPNGSICPPRPSPDDRRTARRIDNRTYSSVSWSSVAGQENLIEATQDGVRTLTLNRPHRHNAFDDALYDALYSAVRAALEDSKIRVLLLQGAGRSFSSGRDSAVLGQHGEEGMFVFARRAQELNRRLYESPKPVVAAVRGYALGMGLETALAADIRIVSTDVEMGLPEVRYGLVTDNGGASQLAVLAGPARAKYLLMSGQRIDAALASAWGLAEFVVEPERLDEEAFRLAASIARAAPLAVEYAKDLVNMQTRTAIANGMRAEMLAELALFSSADYQEAKTAAREKREPKFRGR